MTSSYSLIDISQLCCEIGAVTHGIDLNYQIIKLILSYIV